MRSPTLHEHSQNLLQNLKTFSKKVKPLKKLTHSGVLTDGHQRRIFTFHDALGEVSDHRRLERRQEVLLDARERVHALLEALADVDVRVAGDAERAQLRVEEAAHERPADVGFEALGHTLLVCLGEAVGVDGRELVSKS